MRIIFWAILLFLAVSFPALAQTNWSTDQAYNQAREAMIAGRYAEALPGIRRASDAGYGPAQHNLAIFYRDGLSVTQSDTAARALFEKAYRAGVPVSKTELGQMYLQGRGGPARASEGLALLQAAADGGNPSGYFQLGIAYDIGRGVTMDRHKALSYYEKAANAGHVLSAYNAGQMLLIGDKGVEPDMDKALMFWRKAAEKNDKSALTALGFVYRSGFAGFTDIQSGRDYFYKAEAAGSAAASRLLQSFNEDAYQDAMSLQGKGQHTPAKLSFWKLCEWGVQKACTEYGQYLAFGAKGINPVPDAALVVLDEPCRTQSPGACETRHFVVLKTGASAGQSRIQAAAKHYKSGCERTPKSYSDCYNLAYMHYYPTFGMYNLDRARKLTVDACFNGGEKSACPMAYHIMNNQTSRTSVKTQSSKPSKSSGLGSFMSDLFTGLSAMSSSSGYSYSSQSYSSGSMTSSTPIQTSNSRQDWTNFNNAVNAINNIGTGYNSSCRSSNPYC